MVYRATLVVKSMFCYESEKFVKYRIFSVEYAVLDMLDICTKSLSGSEWYFVASLWRIGHHVRLHYNKVHQLH